MAEQPAALRRLAAANFPNLGELAGSTWDRIVLTGMGSSLFAGIPTWRALTALGHQVWNIDTGQLLDNLGLVTPDTLLIITSQSGASGEVVELLNRRDEGQITPALVIGISDDQGSALARSADVFLPLHSGAEATVSTKSYLNSLAVHRILIGHFSRTAPDYVVDDLYLTADVIAETLSTVDLTAAAVATAQHPSRRLAYVGRKDEAATAKFSALITKESSKVPAEGFVGGQFRHGPFELAGDGLTVVLFGMHADDPDRSLHVLAQDLITAGSRVVVIGDTDVPGAQTVQMNPANGLGRLAAGSVAAELFAVDLARANNVVPGAFLYGSKITTTV
ncbi:SIS domain-containing protein [Arthrobacter sp. CAN_A6]|uniref:SIS domain-containing protein n=1 Tax=Arthrobacter sp. CAN_A6 TaxID=2787721 RepID=UPI002FF40491